LGSNPPPKQLEREKAFFEEQIFSFLREAEAGIAVKDPYRRHGFGEALYYLWRNKFGGMRVSDARQLKGVETENGPLTWNLSNTMSVWSAFLPEEFRDGRHTPITASSLRPL